MHDADPALPALSCSDAAALVEIAQKILLEAELPSSYDGAGYLQVGDVRLPLASMASSAAKAARQSWPTVVRRHVHNLLAVLAASLPATLDEARTLLLPLLRSNDPARPLPEYAEEILPGVMVLAALDYRSHVTDVMSDDLIAHYGGWTVVMNAAMINLQSLPEPTISDVIGDPNRDDSTVHVLMFEDSFGASRLLRLPEVLSGIGVERPRHGVLVAVPHRHLLAVHVVRGEGVVPALRALSRLASREFGTGPGPISPHVYYRSPGGQAQQVTRIGTSGEVSLSVAGPLAETLRALGLSESW